MKEKVEMYENLVKIVHRVYCEDCGAELCHTGLVYTIDPPLYEYFCPNCNKRITSHTSYPWIEYKGELVDG